MKKNVILMSAFVLLAGTSFSQSKFGDTKDLPQAERRLTENDLRTGVANKNEATSSFTKPVKNDGNSKALGTVLWHETFGTAAGDTSHIVDASGTPLADYTNFKWTIDNDTSTTYPEHGWAIGPPYEGWTAMFSPNNNGSGMTDGNYLQVNNGYHNNAAWEDPAMGVTYTITSDPINVANLDGTGQVYLTFEHKGMRLNDLMKMEISTNGSTWTPIFSSTSFSANVPWGAFDAAPYNAPPHVTEVDLQPLIASNLTSVQFRFQWESRFPTDSSNIAWLSYGWYIDNIKIHSKSDFDLVSTYNVYHFDHLQYSQIPKAQAAAPGMKMSVRQGLSNMGSQTLNNVKVQLSGAVTHTSAPIASMASNSTDTINMTATTGPGASLTDTRVSIPSTVGVHTIQQALVLDETDDNPANNGVPNISFEVTDYTYACDHGAPYEDFPLRTLSLNNAAVSVEGIGVEYSIYADQALYGVDFRYARKPNNSAPLGTESEVKAELYIVNVNTNNYDKVTETGLFQITTDAQADQTHTIPFEDSIVLQAGNTYLALIRVQDKENIELACSGIVPDNPAIVFPDAPDVSAGMGVIFAPTISQVWIGYAGCIPVVRLNFDPTTPPPLPSCAFTNTTSPTLCVDSSLTLNVNETGGNWTTSQPTIASVADGVVTGLATGTATITYNQNGAATGCTGTVSRTISIVNSGSACGATPPPPSGGGNTSVEDIENLRAIAIFPNPTSNKVNIEFELKNSANVTIEVTDLTGKVIATKQIKNAHSGTNLVSMDSSEYARGIYSVSVKTNDSLSTHKLIKN